MVQAGSVQLDADVGLSTVLLVPKTGLDWSSGSSRGCLSFSGTDDHGSSEKQRDRPRTQAVPYQ